MSSSDDLSLKTLIRNAIEPVLFGSVVVASSLKNSNSTVNVVEDIVSCRNSLTSLLNPSAETFSVQEKKCKIVLV